MGRHARGQREHVRGRDGLPEGRETPPEGRESLPEGRMRGSYDQHANLCGVVEVFQTIVLACAHKARDSWHWT